MNRRTLLSAVGTAAAGALAGCLSSAADGDGDGDDGDGSTPTDTPTATPSPTASPTKTSGCSPVEEEFTVENVGSGTGKNEATVSFDGDVVVDGTIRGKNGCYTASLGSVGYEDGSLTVVVESHEKEGAEACTQALVDIDYLATFTFDGELPDTVTVEHDVDGERTTVAEASP